MLLLRGEPSGEVASHCNPRHKGARNPNSSKDSVKWCTYSRLQVTVCVGAARNLWTRQDVGVELSRNYSHLGSTSGRNGRYPPDRWSLYLNRVFETILALHTLWVRGPMNIIIIRCFSQVLYCFTQNFIYEGKD